MPQNARRRKKSFVLQARITALIKERAENAVAGKANVFNSDGLHELARGLAPFVRRAMEKGLLQGNMLRAIRAMDCGRPGTVKSHAGRAHGRGQVQRSGVGTDKHFCSAHSAANSVSVVWGASWAWPFEPATMFWPICFSFSPAQMTSVGKLQAFPRCAATAA